MAKGVFRSVAGKMKERIKKSIAGWLRRLSSRFDHAHLVVVAANENGPTMVAYLAALARKKDFSAWTEYHNRVAAKEAGRYVKAKPVR